MSLPTLCGVAQVQEDLIYSCHDNDMGNICLSITQPPGAPGDVISRWVSLVLAWYHSKPRLSGIAIIRCGCTHVSSLSSAPVYFPCLQPLLVALSHFTYFPHSMSLVPNEKWIQMCVVSVGLSVDSHVVGTPPSNWERISQLAKTLRRVHSVLKGSDISSLQHI